jgi:galactose-1-phosphate uridylyltransferase
MWPNSQSIVTSDIDTQQFQNITVLKVSIAVVSVKVVITSDKHAASVVRVKVLSFEGLDIRFLLERYTYT